MENAAGRRGGVVERRWKRDAGCRVMSGGKAGEGGRQYSPSARSFRLCNPPSANTELISRELAPPFPLFVSLDGPKTEMSARMPPLALGSPPRSSFPSHTVPAVVSLSSIHLRSRSCFCLLFELPSSPVSLPSHVRFWRFSPT